MTKRQFLLRTTSMGVAMWTALTLAPTAGAQWLKYPTPGVPRTPDGKPNMTAPAPRAADGKPDLSGIWLANSTRCNDPEKLVCGSELPFGREGMNMGVGVSGGLPYQPWLAALVKERTANQGK